MLSAGGVVPFPFAILSHVDEPEFLARIELQFDLLDGDFADARPGVLAEFFKCFRMLHHFSSENGRANWPLCLDLPKDQIEGIKAKRTVFSTLSHIFSFFQIF